MTPMVEASTTTAPWQVVLGRALVGGAIGGTGLGGIAAGLVGGLTGSFSPSALQFGAILGLIASIPVILSAVVVWLLARLLGQGRTVRRVAACVAAGVAILASSVAVGSLDLAADPAMWVTTAVTMALVAVTEPWIVRARAQDPTTAARPSESYSR